jgi:polysaccharide pyruvyl transferase WcaK-like protein
MKYKHPRITLLGNNSGRNLGDAAILASILDSVTEELPDAEFYVPTTHTEFNKKHYEHLYNVKTLNVMPWTGSVRLFGIPTLIAMAKSDLALICDGIIFGKNFFNPTFNYLITLAFLVPFAKLFKCKLVCYNCGIGPFPVKLSEKAAKYVIESSDLVIMRENDSKKLAQKLGVTKDIEVTGDAAFINKVSSEEKANEILESHGIDSNLPFFGINVTSYIDSWLKKDEKVEGSKDAFFDMLAKGIKKAQDSLKDKFQPVFFSTHPMDNDFCDKLAKEFNTMVINNTEYLSHDIQAVMKKCQLFMGMRFHSLVLASAVYSPVIGLVYAPKVRGYMRLLDCDDLNLELKDINVEVLANTISNAWTKRFEIQAKQKVIVDKLKKGARQAATTLRETFYPNYKTAKVKENKKSDNQEIRREAV